MWASRLHNRRRRQRQEEGVGFAHRRSTALIARVDLGPGLDQRTRSRLLPMLGRNLVQKHSPRQRTGVEATMSGPARQERLWRTRENVEDDERVYHQGSAAVVVAEVRVRSGRTKQQGLA